MDKILRGKKRFLFVVNSLPFFYSHRLPLAKHALKRGFEVNIAYGEELNPSENVALYKNFNYWFIPQYRGEISFFKNIRLIFALLNLFRVIKPDLVHLITMKPILFGGIAARIVGIKAIVSSVTGTGFFFKKNSAYKIVLMRALLKPLFKFSMNNANQKIIVQNQHDKQRIASLSGKPIEEMELIAGSGVNLREFSYFPEPAGKVRIVMASRLLWDKGVGVFYEAAKRLNSNGANLEFLLAGKPDTANPSSISDKTLKEWHKSGNIKYLGFINDVPQLYASCHIVAFPSFYGEGLPKCLIEAAACGRPIITTNTPGCSDAIIENITGYLVPEKDVEALSRAILKLANNIELRQKMGLKARDYATEKFNIKNVVCTHFKIYDELLDS